MRFGVLDLREGNSSPLRQCGIASRCDNGFVYFDFDNNGGIYAHPGNTVPTVVSWTSNSIRTLKFKSINTACNRDDVIRIQIAAKDADEVSKEFDLPKGKQISVDMSPWNNTPSTLTISKGKSSGCDNLRLTAE